MLWDIFCRVIDNFGDIGVCWRLTNDLAQRGHTARLWVDDASALAWMAPADQRPAGIEVLPWQMAEQLDEAAPALQPGDVVIEAFGCEIPTPFLARMPRAVPPRWLNLEYLSAEDYVARSHGLPSPVWQGPAAGLTKHFFYPGFTPDTGGLLREPGLLAAREAHDRPAAQAWLARLGVPCSPSDRCVALFCYPSAPVPALLDRLAATGLPDGGMVRVLLTSGAATQMGQAWLTQQTTAPAGLTVHPLPALPQSEFDRVLWSCDLNFVRGEDSAVRALWAGVPHVWQIYEQDDGVHADKLEAFMRHWMADWPDALRSAVHDLWLGWNGLAPLPDRLPDWRASTDAWRQWSARASARQAEQRDLVTELLRFVDATE